MFFKGCELLLQRRGQLGEGVSLQEFCSVDPRTTHEGVVPVEDNHWKGRSIDKRIKIEIEDKVHRSCLSFPVPGGESQLSA